MEDYFRHFGIPRAYQLDTDALRKSYYKMSKSLHPDVLQSGISTYEINKAISFHNKAYQILLQPLSRLKYIVEIEGFGDQIETPLDPEFLMEMMEYHEEIEEATNSEDSIEIEKLLQKLLEFEGSKTESMKSIFNSYDSGDRSENIISKLTTYFVQLRYIRRLRKALLQEEEL